jgi:hypothetical protein
LSQREDAEALQYVLNHRGGQLLMSMLDEQIKEPKDEFYAKMASNPETMIGKKGIKLSARAKGLEDFKDSLTDLVKTLTPTRSRGGS